MSKYLGLLSTPVNQYISQTLQYYLSQFIEDIELEGELSVRSMCTVCVAEYGPFCRGAGHFWRRFGVA